MDSVKEQRLLRFKKSFEDFLPSVSVELSLFEFCETFDREIGLTNIVNENNGNHLYHKKHFCKIAESGNIEISALCLK